MKLIDISTPKFPNKFAKVDDEDFDFLNQWGWGVIDKAGFLYANRMLNEKGPRLQITMHRAIMLPPKTLYVDHIDGDGLNNQRSNLRICTNSQNQMNQRPQIGGTSKYKGVHFSKKAKRFVASIKVNRKDISLKTHANEVDAAKAYDAAAIKYFGEFARLNFPLGGQDAG